jgi:hypothetical protein
VITGKALQSPDDENLHLVVAKARGKDGVEQVGVWTTSHLGKEERSSPSTPWRRG